MKSPSLPPGPSPSQQPFRVSRRDALMATVGLAGTAALGTARAADAQPKSADARRGSPQRFDMKKSINLWAFPYPDKMTLEECLRLAKNAGFDGIELNYDLDNDLSP